jgi:hypothetical protein
VCTAFVRTLQHTTKKQQTGLREDDLAFVVARLHFPCTAGTTAAEMASAWPADVVGFNHLDPEPSATPDLVVEAALAEQQELQQQGGGVGDNGAALFAM